MSKRGWIIFAAICVAVLGGLVYFSNSNRVNVSDVNVDAVQAASEKSGNIADHVFGKSDSKVILIEYGDFQCPGCGNAHPTVKALTEKYKDQIAFVFRNFPITSKHPNAKAAAAAVEAAGLQGKYWEMHNRVFESQSSWGNLDANQRGGFFEEYASELDLDVEKFKNDYASESVNQKISFDQAVGKKAGAEATPSFRLNGQPVGDDTWNNEENFEKALTDAMKQAGIEVSAQQ